MHIRLLTWLFLCVSLAVLPLNAQVQAQASLTKPGAVIIAKVSGTVNMTVNGASNPVRVNDVVPQGAKIVTQLNSSVVLVFSNGATTQLGPDTDFVMEEFMQDEFPSTIKVADLVEEPSPSRTKIVLNKGEIVGNVKKLKHGNGSSFTVQTPVGAAGIRGTTFRIVFRPTGTGQAFGAQGAQNFQFQRSTLEGDVGFQQGVTGGPGAGTGGAQTNTGGVTTGQVSINDVSVPTGQEIVVTVTVTQNAQGQIVTVTPPAVSSTVAITPTAAAAFAAAAQEIISTSANATFTPPSQSPPGTPGGTSGGGTTGTVGSTTTPTPSFTSTQTTPTTSPAATPPPPRLTPGGS